MDFRKVESELEITRIYRENAEILRFDDPNPSNAPKRMIFVDGKQRHLLRYEEFPSKKVLVSQVVVGAVMYCCKKLEILGEPKSVFVVAMTQNMDADFGFRIENVNSEVRVVNDGDLSQVSSEIMAEMELNMSRDFAERGKGIVVKDGSMKPIFQLRLEPTFVKGSGPVGLVKNVESVLDPRMEEELLSGLDVGERSKSFITKYSEDYGRIEIVSSYVRLGKNSFVRLDAVISNRSYIEDVFELFDSLTKALSEISIDVPYGRYPEDIPPIQGLEQILGAYLYDPSTVESLFQLEGGAL